MGTTLTGTTPQDTYDSLIKVTDNGPLSGTLKALSDGLGNDSTLSLSTAAASIAGTLAVTGNATFDTNTLFVDAAANEVGIGTIVPSQKLHVSAGNFLVCGTAIGSGADANSGLRILAPVSTTHYNWMLAAQQNIGGGFEITPSTAVGGTTFSTPALSILGSSGNVGIGQSAPAAKLEVGGASANTDFRISRTVDPTAYTYITAPGGATLTAAIGISGTDVFSIDTNKYIRFAAASGGIQFNGDTAAANALDDYEEGTWTPVYRQDSTPNTATYTNQSGTYTKIGNIVTVFFDMTASSITAGSGFLNIGGLPFTVGSGMAGFSYGGVRDPSSLSLTNQIASIFAERSYTFLRIISIAPLTGQETTVTAYAASGRLTGTIQYTV